MEIRYWRAKLLDLPAIQADFKTPTDNMYSACCLLCAKESEMA